MKAGLLWNDSGISFDSEDVRNSVIGGQKVVMAIAALPIAVALPLLIERNERGRQELAEAADIKALAIDRANEPIVGDAIELRPAGISRKLAFTPPAERLLAAVRRAVMVDGDTDVVLPTHGCVALQALPTLKPGWYKTGADLE